jgi:hypothetical protein
MSDRQDGQPIYWFAIVLAHFLPVLSGIYLSGINTFASCLGGLWVE